MPGGQNTTGGSEGDRQLLRSTLWRSLHCPNPSPTKRMRQPSGARILEMESQGMIS